MCYDTRKPLFSYTYPMHTLFITNRKQQKLAVLIDKAEHQKGLAFVMHGLGGRKEQKHIVAIAETFSQNNFTVVRFDTTNTFGESDGQYELATVTNYYEDLEDVIAWARTQDWYQEPFVLSGHSIGGMCVTLFAEQHPEMILGLTPFAPVVSGKLSAESHRTSEPEKFARWEQTGWREDINPAHPEHIKKLPWSHMLDRLTYDVLPQASQLTMPVLLVVGEIDTSTPAYQVKLLFDVLPKEKEFHSIAGAPHNFREPKHLNEFRHIFHDWIKKLAP